MANISDIHSIVVSASEPNFTAHTYNQIIGGPTGCTMTINGVFVNVAAQSSFKLWVRSISGGAGCYLFGENQNVLQGSTELSSYGIIDDSNNSFVVDDYIDNYFV